MVLKPRLDEHRRSVRNYHCEKIKLQNTVWKEIKTLAVAHRERRLIPRKIKETKHIRIQITLTN